jgi:hypothetical protein
MFGKCGATRGCAEVTVNRATLPENGRKCGEGVEICASHTSEVKRNGYTVRPLSREER